MAKKYNTPYNYVHDPTKGEINEGRSLTLQGEAYTIKEILDRHTTGILPDQGREDWFYGTEDFDEPDLEKFLGEDLFEKETISKMNREKLHELKRKVQDKVKENQEKEAAELIAKSENVSGSDNANSDDSKNT
jgi:hypothetical protein